MVNQKALTALVPRVALWACIAAIPIAALAETPVVDVFAVPDEGEGPLDVRIVVRASDPDLGTLHCKISYLGDNGPFDVHDRFILEQPYPEVVFNYTYPSSTVDYTPTVSCQGNGVTSDFSPVTVSPSPTNGVPSVTLTPPSAPSDVSVPVPFVLSTDDSDGDVLHCRLDWGEFGAEIEEIVIGPPYDDVDLSHRYARADAGFDRYRPQVRCDDGRGSTGRHTVLVEVEMSPGNVAPTFNLVRLNSMRGPAPYTMGYRMQSISDSNSDALNCYFDARDGLGRQPFTVNPPYRNVSFSATYTQHFELDFPVITCTDGHGGYFSDSDFVGVNMAVGNVAPTVSLSASTASGASPLGVTFSVNANDVNGDLLHCELDYGFGQGVDSFEVSAGTGTLIFEHAYASQNSYQARVDCHEDRGGSAFDTAWVFVDPESTPDNFDPIVRLNPSQTQGEATLSVSFFVTGSDPDGDNINCSVDFGDGSSNSAVALNYPLYSQVWLPHSYHTASSEPYRAVLTCSDGQGGSVSKVEEIRVGRSPDNSMPVINGFDVSPSGGEAPLDVTFDIAADDSDSYQLSCTLDYGDGTSHSLVNLVPFNVVRTHDYAPGVYTAQLYCCDDVGFSGTCGPTNPGVAAAEATVTAGGPNNDPLVSMGASVISGRGPLQVDFSVLAMDPDGDVLTCTLDRGPLQGSQEFMIEYPYDPTVLSHTYTMRSVFRPTVTCYDGRGGTSAATVSIMVESVNGSNPRRNNGRPGGDGENTEIDFGR